jgi:hypothetical protein
MQLTGQAGPAGTSVAEGLDAADRDPQRVLGVPVALERDVAQVHLGPLQSDSAAHVAQQIRRVAAARSFKTGAVSRT